MDFGKSRQNIIRTLKETNFPKDIIVETTANCNLKCIMCPQSTMTRPRGNMSFEVFKKIADEVAKHPKSRMWLAIMGEPLLDPEVLLMKVRYAKRKDIYLCLNTNGTLMEEYISEQLIMSGLDEVLIGIDAYWEDTYSKIRVGGSYSKVVHNIRWLLKHKKLHNTKLKVIVQYIVMPENEEEVEDFKEYWLGEGAIVKIRPKLGWRVGQTFGLDYNGIARYPCPWLINACSIQWNGKLNQCDGGWDGSYSPGDITRETISEVWNGELARRRAKHWKGEFDHPLCKDCEDWMVPKSKFYYPRSKYASI